MKTSTLDVIVIANNDQRRRPGDGQEHPAVELFTTEQLERIRFGASGCYPVLQRNGVDMTRNVCDRTFGELGSRIARDGPVVVQTSGNSDRPLFLNGICLLQELRDVGLTAELINDLADPDYSFCFDLLMRRNPAVVVISTTFLFTRQRLEETARQIRNRGCSATIIAGGPFVVKCAKYARWLQSVSGRERDACQDMIDAADRDYLFIPGQRQSSTVDWFVTASPGLDVLVDSIKAIKQGEELTEMPNLACVRDDSWFFTHDGPHDRSLRFGPIRWNDLSDIRERHDSVPIQLTNGCPFACKFCDFHLFSDGRRYERTPLDLLERELEALTRSGPIPKSCYLVNDNLIMSESLSRETARLFRKYLRGRTALSTLADLSFARSTDTVRRWADAGLRTVFFGVESGSQRILANMDKPGTPDTNLEKIHRFHDGGVRIHALLLVGFPGETSETIAETIAFMNSFPTRQSDMQHTYNVSTLIVLPMTPISSTEERARYSLTGIGECWEHETMTCSEALKWAVEMHLEIEGATYSYEQGESVSRSFHNARRRLCRMDFRRPGCIDKLDAPAVRDAWAELIDCTSTIDRGSSDAMN